jgi:hypothetical protein
MEIICKIYLNNYLFWFSSLLPGGLKILILNGSGLQIQTSGMTRTSAGSGALINQYQFLAFV